AVGRGVVHHQHLQAPVRGESRGHDGADVVALVVGGDDDQRFHSLSSTRATRAVTASQEKSARMRRRKALEGLSVRAFRSAPTKDSKSPDSKKCPEPPKTASALFSLKQTAGSPRA